MTPRSTSGKRKTDDASEDLEREIEAHAERGRGLARALVEKGKSLVAPLLEQVRDESVDDPAPSMFREAADMFEAAIGLDPENTEAEGEMEKLLDVLEEEEPTRPPPNHDDPLDVVIVGAGASGIGLGIMLTRTFNLDPERVLIIDRGEVGESFLRWPREMRFISPSFNSQGWTGSFDLNSVAFGTSPAYTIHSEHPTGEQYAYYLRELAKAGELNVKTHTEVTAVRPRRRGGFIIDVVPTGNNAANAQDQHAQDQASQPVKTSLWSRYVIWAAGEFQYPHGSTSVFPGSELCRHNSTVESWKTLSGNDFVVIGGYESGMDAASNLAACTKRCTLVSSTAYWRVSTDDPSTELAPHTMVRIDEALRTSVPPRLLAPLRVFKVERDNTKHKGGYVVRARWGAPVDYKSGEYTVLISDEENVETGEEGAEIELYTPQPPLLCTGFEGSVALGAVKELFEFSDGDGEGCAADAPLLNEYDESTKTPGLFLAGPAVSHDGLVFCFVYKFRQRFAVVADAIARGLGHKTAAAVDKCREMNMFLDDFSCCKGACGEAC